MSLHDFYVRAAHVDEDQITEIKNRYQCLFEVLKPKIKRLCSQVCMKLIDIIEYGSSIDQIISGDCRCLDICLIFDKSGLKLDHSKSGYICIPLYKNRPGKSTKRDRWNFGRSLADGGISLSPKTTLITLIEIIGRAVNTLTPELRKSTLLVENEGLVRLKLSNFVDLNISVGFKNESEDSYFVSRIFNGDDIENGLRNWRIIRPNQEYNILAGTTLADRGNRIKAVRCMKALVALEPTIYGINSYQIKTAQLIATDEGIDTNYRWQRAGLEVCFVNLLTLLSNAFNSGSLRNFYNKDENLLESVDPRIRQKLSTRLAFLVLNHGEIIRIVKKRAFESLARIDHIDEFIKADIEAAKPLEEEYI